MPAPRTLSSLLTSPLGLVLAALTGVLARLLRQRPLHPWGVTVHAALVADDGDDTLPAGRTEAVSRVSLGAGTPRGWPDVVGIALRWHDGDGRPQDLLLSSAGPGPVSRFVPMPRRRILGWFSTVMPLRTPTGPALLALRPARETSHDGAVVLDVLRASPRGPWRRVGRLELLGPTAPGREGDAREQRLRFDPTDNAPHGLGTYGWEDGLRSLPYAAARRAAPDAP